MPHISISLTNFIGLFSDQFACAGPIWTKILYVIAPKKVFLFQCYGKMWPYNSSQVIMKQLLDYTEDTKIVYISNYRIDYFYLSLFNIDTLCYVLQNLLVILH